MEMRFFCETLFRSISLCFYFSGADWAFLVQLYKYMYTELTLHFLFSFLMSSLDFGCFWKLCTYID